MGDNYFYIVCFDILFMEEIKFRGNVPYSDNIYEKVENVLEEIMSSYSRYDAAKKIDVNDIDSPRIAKSIIYNGDDLLELTYGDVIKNCKLDFDINLYGNDEGRLTEIESEIVKGLESLL